MKMRVLGPALFGLLLLQACTIQTFALRSLDNLFNNTVASFMEEGDLRLAEQGVAGNLKLLDGVAKSDPENDKFMLLACQGYAAYALAFAEDSPARALEFYTRAQRYGARGLELLGVPRKVFSSDAPAMRRALERLEKKDVPLVFWTASAWGSAVILQLADPDAIVSLPSINAMMEWVKEKDSTYYYGGPYLYFGMYYGSFPPLLGGRPDLAKENFERAIAAGGGKFLMTYVFYAKIYAVETQDERLFEDLLAHVIDASADVLPEQRLANAVAKKRAQEALARKGDFF
jgi:hypothetical protein